MRCQNLNAICQAHLADRHEIEVVNVFRDPQRALAEGIRMTPTLLKLAPAPVRRIVGTLSQTQRVLETLGLETGAATVAADAKGSDHIEPSSSPTHR